MLDHRDHRLTQRGMSYVLLILDNIFQAGLGTKGRNELMAFADGTKLGGTSSAEGISVLLEELDNIECWHIGNGMKFNSGKYKVMHLGNTNKNLLQAGSSSVGNDRRREKSGCIC